MQQNSCVWMKKRHRKKHFSGRKCVWPDAKLSWRRWRWRRKKRDNRVCKLEIQSPELSQQKNKKKCFHLSLQQQQQNQFASRSIFVLFSLYLVPVSFSLAFFIMFSLSLLLWQKNKQIVPSSRNLLIYICRGFFFPIIKLVHGKLRLQLS